jgi:hypothetical protein
MDSVRKSGLFFTFLFFVALFMEGPQIFHWGLGIQEAQAQSFKVGSFAKSTTTPGPVSQTVAHGLGETPKALILWTNAKTNEAFSASFQFGFGVTDQNRASYSAAASSQNGVNPTACGRRMAAAALTIANFTGTTLAEATVTAWDTNNFTLSWNPNDANAYVIHFIAIGGSYVSSKAVSWTMTTAVGNKSVTGVGFKPDVVIHAHAGHTFNLGVGNGTTDAMLGLGVMDVSGNQWADFVFSRNARTTTDTQRGQKTDACIYSFSQTLAVQKKAQFRSMDSDGFTVAFTNTTSAVASNVVSLALKGLNAKAGSFGKTVPAPAYVQSTSIQQLSNVVTLTLPSVSTSGNLIVLSFNHSDQSISVSSVTDSAGNSYTLAVGPTNWGTEKAYTYYAANIKGGSQITITITLSAAPSLYGEFYVAEYSGVATTNPLDQTSVGTGTGTAFDSGSKTTTQASELIYGFVDSGGNATVDPSFTARETLNQNALADRTVSSTGSYHFFGTLGSSTGWVAHMATFKGSGATQAVRGVGFQPAVVLLASVQYTIQTSDTAVAETRFGLGASNTTGQGSSAFADKDALVTPTLSSVQGIDKTSKVFMKVNNNTSTIDAEANLTSMDTGGFTLNWTTNDAVATEIVYLALGAPQGGLFQYKRQITINALSCSETLSNFPVLISLSGSWLRTQANDPTNGRISNANGYDIIFRDSTNNQLYHEIEEYDGGASAGTLVAWVRVPSLPQAGTTIYMYYGNAAITSPTANPTGVWDTNYQSVWHLGSNLLDSTNSNNDGTDSGGSSSVTGKVGLGRSFDGVNDYIYTTNAITSGYTNLTLEAWVKTSSATGVPILSFEGNNRTGTTNAYWDSGLYVGTDHYLYFYVYYDATNYFPHAVGSYNDGTWHHLVGVSNSATGSTYVYVDGSQADTAGRTDLDTTSRYWRIGSYKNVDSVAGADGYFNGQVDEVRISTAARSACWIRTEYDNQKVNSTLVTVGAEGGAAPTAVTLSGFTATEYEDGVLLEWKTGYEVNNLGFHIYREQDGQLYRLTPELVAGSALLAGQGTVLGAGHSYFWWDILPSPQSSLSPHRSSLSPVRYWLKDVDLGGKDTMHGPVTPVFSQGPLPGKVKPELLSEVGMRLQEKYEDYWKVQELKEKIRSRGLRSVSLKEHFVLGARSLKTAPLKAEQNGLLASSPAGTLLKGRWPAPQGNLVPDPQTQQFLAGSAAVKILVKEEGWYRVTQPELVGVGLDPKVNPRHLQLYVDGREEPIRVISKREGRFGPGDAIEFYGVGLDTPCTDTKVYWLIEGTQPGKRIDNHIFNPPFRNPHSAIRNSFASFPYTVEKKERRMYISALKNGDEENFFGAVVAKAPVDQVLRLSHLDPAPSEEAMLEVSLQGVTDAAHRVKVELNGSEVGEVVFEGMVKGLMRWAIPQSGLEEEDNLVTLESRGGEKDVSLVDHIRLTYWHTYTADSNLLEFTAQGGRELSLDGFSHPNLRVIDITDSRDVIEVIGKVRSQGLGYSVSFRVPGHGGYRTLLAFTEERVKSPKEIVANQPSSWHESGQGYDLVIISYRDFLGSLQPLKKLRESQGLRVGLIDVEDLYDEFNFGNKSPKAIKDFLTLAKTHWRKPPRFVLLVGDASFDPRNYYGFGDVDFVPTKLIDTAYMETASDDWFVDFNGDGLPETAIGRLPVQTVEEAAIVVSKIVGYGQATRLSEALLVADMKGEKDLDFEAASEEVRELLPPNINVRKIFRSHFGSDPQARGEIIRDINLGPLLVNFIGHGTVWGWNGDLLSTGDADYLTNGLRLPFFMSMTCLNGWFHDPYLESLAEMLLKAKGGGAVAVWTSSGLTEPDKQTILNKELIRLLFNNKEALTIGEAVMRAKASVSDQDIRKTWILFGDPTTKLK